MINLIRSNVGGHGLNHVLKDQPAFAKSMKEYAIVKFLRGKRKNKKQLIVWGGTEKKEVEVTTNFEELKPAPAQTKEQKEAKVEPPKPEIKEQTEEPKQAEQVEVKPASTFSYDPKKQSYVWVYSVRRKFACLLDGEAGSFTEEQLK
jgi:hypothetical protein